MKFKIFITSYVVAGRRHHVDVNSNTDVVYGKLLAKSL